MSGLDGKVIGYNAESIQQAISKGGIMSPFALILINAHPNVRQPSITNLDEPQFHVVLNIRARAAPAAYGHLGGVTWPRPGKSSNHTNPRVRPASSSPSCPTSIGGSPTMAVGSAATPVNMPDGASKTCAMPGEPFGCSVFDIGRVGSYDAPSNVSAIADKLQFAACDTPGTRNSRGVRSP